MATTHFDGNGWLAGHSASPSVISLATTSPSCDMVRAYTGSINTEHLTDGYQMRTARVEPSGMLDFIGRGVQA